MLQPKRREQLDANIRELLANGGTNEDIEKMAADFTAKFSDEALKKKEPSVATSTVPNLGSNGADGSLEPVKPANGFPEIKPLKGVVPDFAAASIPVNTQKPKKKKEERGLIAKKLDDLGRGSAQLWADVAAIPEFTYDIFSAPQNAVADMFDIPSLRANSDKFKEHLGIRNAVKEYYQNEVQKSREHAQLVDRQYEQGIYDSFKNGDIKGGFDQLSSSFLESLPASASMMVGGAYAKAPQLLAASTAVFGAGKNEQLKKENPQMNANARVSNALATGLAEGAFETLSSGSFGAAAKGIIEREGVKKGTTILKDGIYDFLTESAKKNPFLTEISTEGLSELATTITQNSVDVATGVKPEDYNVFTGGADSFIAGAFGGGVFGGVIHGMKEVTTYQDKQAVKQNTKQIFELQKDLANPTLPEDIRAQINLKVDNLIKSNQQIVQQTRKSVEALSPSVRSKLIESIDNMETFEAQAKQIQTDSSLSTDTKTILLNDLKTQYKKDAEIKQNILQGNYTPVDALPLKQQDTLKREALKQLTEEMNPEGKKDITITNEMISKRANKLHEENISKQETKKTFDNLSLKEYNDFINLAHEDLASKNVPAEERTSKKVRERASQLYEESLQAPVEDVTRTDERNIEESQVNIPLEAPQGEEIVTEEAVNLPQENIPAAQTFSQALNEPNINYVYNGEKGNIRLDGQQVVFETPNSIHELGNAEDLSQNTLADFGIAKDRINLNSDNTIEIDGNVFVNPETQDRGKAVKKGKKGETIVTLIGPDNSKVTFTGDDAVQIADLIQNQPEINVEDPLETQTQSDETQTENAPAIDGNFQPGASGVAESGISEEADTGKERVQQSADTGKSAVDTGKKEPKKETAVKSISRRLIEGGNSKAVTDAVEASEINYEKDNQQQTWNKVADMFKDFSSFDMYNAIQNDVITNPSAVTATYGQLLEKMPSDIEKELSKIDNEEDKAALKVLLWEEYGRIVDEFSSRATAFGQANAMVNKVIQQAENVRYNLKRQTDSYKAQNNGVLDAQTQRTFEETDAKLKDLEEKIKALEKEKADQEAQRAVEDVREALAREKKESPKQKAKDLADRIREIKIHKPGSFSAATPASLAWDLGVETIAKTVETGGIIAEAIQNGLEKIKATDWYQNLSEEQKKNAVNDFNETFQQDKKGNIRTSGRVITTPSGVEFSADLFREYVRQGMNDIDAIAKQIKEDISDQYPDADIRDIRDGLSGYGKTINPSQDAVSKEMARLRSLGKLLSAKEDVILGELPKRSGLLRAKPDYQLRALRKEINDLIKENGLDSQDLQKKWSSALDKIKSSLKNQIEQLDRQLETGEKRKPERTATELDQEAKALKAERDLKKKLLDEIAGKPELSDEQKIKRAERALESSISKLKRQIELGEFDAERNKSSLESENLTKLREERKELQAQKKQIQIETGAVEKARLEMAKKRVQNQINELQRRIREKDYSKKEVKPVRADEELRALKEEKLRLFEVYDSAVYKAELKNRTAMQKGVDVAMEVVNLMRIASGLDLGLMFLQLGPLTVSRRVTNPILFAKDMVKIVRSIGSEKFSKKMNADIKASPYYPLAEECKLSLTSVDYKLSINEDQFTGDLTNLIWNGPLALASENIGKANEVLNKERKVFGDWLMGKENGDRLSIIQQWKNMNIYPAVERGLITYANMLRMQEFEKGVEMLHLENKNQEDNLPEFKKLAAAVNTLTGRGNLPTSAAGINKLLTAVFFSPRNAVAIVNQVNPYWYGSLQHDSEGGLKSPITIKGGKIQNNLTVANKLAIQNMARYVAITTTFALLVKAAYGDDAEELEWDPRSYNSGKIIVKGKDGNKISFDPWAGKYHQVSMFAKLFLEQTKDVHTGELTSLQEADRGSKTRGEIFGEYAGNKLSPAGSFAWNYLTAKTETIEGKEVKVNRYTGEPIKGSFLPSLAPMYWAGFYELQQEDPSAFTQLLGAASIMGINSNIIKPPKKKTKKSGRGRNGSARGRTAISRR